MTLQRLLPGFEPDYIRIDVSKHAHGHFTVRVYGCAGPGFVSAADSDLYEYLASFEVLDVATASLATLLGL